MWIVDGKIADLYTTKEQNFQVQMASPKGAKRRNLAFEWARQVPHWRWRWVQIRLEQLGKLSHYPDIIGQARALRTDSKLGELDEQIDDLLENEALHIDARGLPGLAFELVLFHLKDFM